MTSLLKKAAPWLIAFQTISLVVFFLVAHQTSHDLERRVWHLEGYDEKLDYENEILRAKIAVFRALLESRGIEVPDVEMQFERDQSADRRRR